MNVPKLRFKGFNEEWELKKIKDIAPLQRGFDLPNSAVQKGVYPVCYSNGILNYHNDYKVKAPGVVTGRSGTLGKVHYIGEDFWPHNTSLWVTDFKGNHPRFIYYFYKNIKLERYTAGSTVPTLNRNNVHTDQKSVPLEFEEQTKIANFLSEIDKKIQLQKERVNLLQQQKKGYMQKIFKQEIRFKNDDGEYYQEWEETTLGECFDNFGGTALEKFTCELGTHKFISIGSYNENSKYNDQGIRININNKTQQKLLNKNDLVMVLNDKTASGNIIGRVLLIEEDNQYIYNQRSERLVAKSKIIPQYAWHFLNSDFLRRNIISLAQGGTQIYVNYSSVAAIKFMLPCKLEQKKITHFLYKLDDKIQIEQQKLEFLHQQKKGLMQQMFI